MLSPMPDFSRSMVRVVQGLSLLFYCLELLLQGCCMGEICNAQKHYASESYMTFFFFFLKSSIFMSNTQENVTARNWGGDFVFSSVFLFSLPIALCSLSLETITLLPPALSACSVVVYRRDYLESCRTTLLKCSNEDKEWYLKTVNWLSRICQGKAKSVGKKANMCSLFVP